MINLIVSKEAKIPSWLRKNCKIKTKRENFNGTDVVVKRIIIENSVNVIFVPDGWAFISLFEKRENSYRKLFPPLVLYEARDRNNNLVLRNHNLCSSCGEMSMTRQRLEDHQEGIIFKKQFTCEICGRENYVQSVKKF